MVPCRALQEIFKTQFALRNNVRSLIDVLQKSVISDDSQLVNSKVIQLSREYLTLLRIEYN